MKCARGFIGEPKAEACEHPGDPLGDPGPPDGETPEGRPWGRDILGRSQVGGSRGGLMVMDFDVSTMAADHMENKFHSYVKLRVMVNLCYPLVICDIANWKMDENGT